jgi:2'-5' RNA ligase
MIRAFVSVPLPDDIRNRLAKFQQTVRSAGGDVKWVRPESLHITLKFLGDVAEARIQDVCEAVRLSAAGIPPFTISVEGTGAFPNENRPRVLWVGISEGKTPLIALAGRLEAEMAKIGFEKEERAYSAHLTIARVRSLAGIEGVVERMRTAGFAGGRFEAGEVKVMKSDLEKSGAVYTALGTIKLQR